MARPSLGRFEAVQALPVTSLPAGPVAVRLDGVGVAGDRRRDA
jgi:hypothetical protein